MRRGINSTTGTFSLAIDDGPFEEFFDDIPLSHWDPDDSIELRDGFAKGWLVGLVGWLVGWLCCLGVEHGGYRNDKKCGDGEFSENL